MGEGGEVDGRRGSWGCWDTFSFLAVIVRKITGLPRKYKNDCEPLVTWICTNTVQQNDILTNHT